MSYPGGGQKDPRLPKNYRVGGKKKCGNCMFIMAGGRCSMWNNAKIRVNYVCNRWKG